MQGPEGDEDYVSQRDINNRGDQGGGGLSTAALAGIIAAIGAVALGALIFVLFGVQHQRKKRARDRFNAKDSFLTSAPTQPPNVNSDINGSSLDSRKHSAFSSAHAANPAHVVQLENPHFNTSMPPSPMHAIPPPHDPGQAFSDVDPYLVQTNHVDPYLVQTNPMARQFESPERQPAWVQQAARGSPFVPEPNRMQVPSMPPHAGSAAEQNDPAKYEDDAPSQFLPFLPQAFDPAGPAPLRGTHDGMRSGTDSARSSERGHKGNQPLRVQSFGSETYKERMQSTFNASGVGTSLLFPLVQLPCFSIPRSRLSEKM
jgi:hypothetical protein